MHRCWNGHHHGYRESIDPQASRSLKEKPSPFNRGWPFLLSLLGSKVSGAVLLKVGI